MTVLLRLTPSHASLVLLFFVASLLSWFGLGFRLLNLCGDFQSHGHSPTCLSAPVTASTSCDLHKVQRVQIVVISFLHVHKECFTKPRSYTCWTTVLLTLPDCGLSAFFICLPCFLLSWTPPHSLSHHMYCSHLQFHSVTFFQELTSAPHIILLRTFLTSLIVSVGVTSNIIVFLSPMTKICITLPSSPLLQFSSSVPQTLSPSHRNTTRPTHHSSDLQLRQLSPLKLNSWSLWYRYHPPAIQLNTRNLLLDHLLGHSACQIKHFDNFLEEIVSVINIQTFHRLVHGRSSICCAVLLSTLLLITSRLSFALPALSFT